MGKRTNQRLVLDGVLFHIHLPDKLVVFYYYLSVFCHIPFLQRLPQELQSGQYFGWLTGGSQKQWIMR